MDNDYLNDLLYKIEKLLRDSDFDTFSHKDLLYYANKDVLLDYLRTLENIFVFIDYKNIGKKSSKMRKKIKRVIHKIETGDINSIYSSKFLNEGS